MHSYMRYIAYAVSSLSIESDHAHCVLVLDVLDVKIGPKNKLFGGGALLVEGEIFSLRNS